MDRKILHLDLDAFYCAVEEQNNPALRRKPFAVGGSPDGRGVVSSCSYAARKFGIHSAMPMAQAVRQCPDLIVVRTSFGTYGDVSRKVMKRLNDLTPLVEKISIDEAFLDVTILKSPAENLARELQTAINQELGLPCSLGVATNKLVAKIANNIGKSSIETDTYPNHIQVVAPGTEAAFLAPLPTKELWGVGKRTAEKLAMLGLETIGDIAEYPEQSLIQHFGKHGASLSQHAKGIDFRPIHTEHEAKSISKEVTFGYDVNDFEYLKRTLRRLSDEVGRQVRKAGLYGTTIRIKFRWSDFSTFTRQITLNYPTNQDEEIFEGALELLTHNWSGKKLRLIGVGMSGFEEEDQEILVRKRQLGLWDDTKTMNQNRNLQETLDTLRDRFGKQSVQRGTSLRRSSRND